MARDRIGRFTALHNSRPAATLDGPGSSGVGLDEAAAGFVTASLEEPPAWPVGLPHPRLNVYADTSEGTVVAA